MNKILTVSVVLILIAVIMPSVVSAALTNYQIQSIIGVLQSFGVDSATIANVQTSLNGGTPNLQNNWCYNFNNNLGFTQSGTNDVTNLHVALQREGISYSPDDVNGYSQGTSNGVMQFQRKYGISPITGYVGVKTRAKLNQLYKCSTVPVSNCKPSWKTGSWGVCMNGQQTRSVTDSNNCGVLTKQPAVFQSCIQKPGVTIRAGNSDGPINIFLTLGNGASVNDSGILLSQSIGLQWSGFDVSSCVASDTLKPTVFSGYKPIYGSQSVTLSGNIKNTSTSSNKISDTFKITCISTQTAKSVSDSVTVNLFYTVNGTCYPSWQCTAWTDCSRGQHTRTCIDSNGCGSLANMPTESESCLILPTVDIKANGSDSTISVAENSSVDLTWASTNATSCTASGNWSGTKNINGSESVNIISSPAVFAITCTNANGTTEDIVVVNTLSGT